MCHLFTLVTLNLKSQPCNTCVEAHSALSHHVTVTSTCGHNTCLFDICIFQHKHTHINGDFESLIWIEISGLTSAPNISNQCDRYAQSFSCVCLAHGPFILAACCHKISSCNALIALPVSAMKLILPLYRVSSGVLIYMERRVNSFPRSTRNACRSAYRNQQSFGLINHRLHTGLSILQYFQNSLMRIPCSTLTNGIFILFFLFKKTTKQKQITSA